jgi:hypothetical protein
MSSAGSDDGAAAVCCMCGDHAMPQELFRCKLCGHRLQHSYSPYVRICFKLHVAFHLASIDQFV